MTTATSSASAPNGESLDSIPFINGADDDITLNAPKGLALQGDTLWVADIDVVRGFDVTTGMSGRRRSTSRRCARPS